MICCVVCCCSYMYVYYFLCFFFFFFFFKQKTAYEMRISDWSSDLCSSDLAHRITSPWKWRHLKSVIVPSVQSPPSMLKLHDFCNRAVLTERGRASRFSCNYHYWVYRNDGSLMGVPDEANFFDLDKKKCGLVPIATDVWEGWIFVNHQKQPEVSLQEFLGDLGTRFAGVC